MLRDFSKEEFDVFIQAGQSNAEGCGLGAAMSPFVPSGDILYLNSDFTISAAQEAVSNNDILANFSLAFCTKYIESGKLQSGRKLLIIRAAVGGTGFLDNRWGMTDDLYLRMIEMIKTVLELNSKNRFVALLWHQGETDAIYNAGRQQHFNNLTKLVDSVRKVCNFKELPFIAGDFVSQWKNDNSVICEPVIAAIKDVCATIGHSQFVETYDLESNDQRVKNQDPIHFCREAQNQLGVRYFDAFCEITGL